MINKELDKIESDKNQLFSRVFKDLKDRRNRILEGKENCIAWGLNRLEKELPGIEQGKYYLITANSKVGRLSSPFLLKRTER